MAFLLLLDLAVTLGEGGGGDDDDDDDDDVDMLISQCGLLVRWAFSCVGHDASDNPPILFPTTVQSTVYIYFT